MTKKERQGIADAFRACLPYLWDGVGPPVEKCSPICGALKMSGHPYCGPAKKVVMKSLAPCGLLSTWLLRQIGDARYDNETTITRLQAHRKAWVLKLIEEFEQ